MQMWVWRRLLLSIVKLFMQSRLDFTADRGGALSVLMPVR